MLRKHGIRLKGDGHVRWFHETDGVECGPDESFLSGSSSVPCNRGNKT
jgi:hypothetical protein